MSFLSPFPLPPSPISPSQSQMTSKAFTELLTTIHSNAGWKDQAETAYSLLQGQVQALALENKELREDARALAAALQRKVVPISSKSLILGREKAESGLEALYLAKNEKLMRENAFLRVEIKAIQAKFEMISAKYANIEAEKQELEEKLALSMSSSREKVHFTHNFPPKAAISAVIHAEKEANRLLAALSVQKGVISAYKSQNESLKESRAEVISHCQELLSTAQSLQQRLIGLDDSRRNSEFAAQIWKSAFEKAVFACKSSQELQIEVANGLEEAVKGNEGLKQLLTLTERLKRTGNLPERPLIEPDRLLPQSFPVVAEPPIGMMEQLARAQQAVVDWAERCRLLEESSGKLLNEGLFQLLTVLYRLKKAVSSSN